MVGPIEEIATSDVQNLSKPRVIMFLVDQAYRRLRTSLNSSLACFESFRALSASFSVSASFAWTSSSLQLDPWDLKWKIWRYTTNRSIAFMFGAMRSISLESFAIEESNSAPASADPSWRCNELMKTCNCDYRKPFLPAVRHPQAKWNLLRCHNSGPFWVSEYHPRLLPHP